MKRIDEIIEIVSTELLKLDWNKTPIELYAPIDYTMSLGGKRIRPALSLFAADMYDGNFNEVIPAALALEVFHNFTLLHDDVMDKAEIRRGKPTVHKKWNENTAILSGDAMLIASYKLLAQVPEKHLKKSLQLFSITATEVCEGQQYDMDFEVRQDVTIEEYIEMIRLKTAVLLAMALKLGAQIANAPQADVDELYNFGINIGLAFQLKDDYLDVYGKEETFGKAIGGDILCNKKTYMLLAALQAADEATQKELKYWLDVKDANPKEKIAAVTSIYNKLHIDKCCEEAMDIYYQKALANLENTSCVESKKLLLKTIAQKLMVRNE